jgi:hypothetical protein
LSIGRWLDPDCDVESIFMTGLPDKPVLGVCEGWCGGICAVVVCGGIIIDCVVRACVWGEGCVAYGDGWTGLMGEYGGYAYIWGAICGDWV